MYVPKIAETASKAVAKLHKIGIAGRRSKYPASNPRPYIEQITVSETKTPPTAKFPSANEVMNEIVKIQSTSNKVKPRLEYERKIITKHIVVTSAAPPRPKIEKSGSEKLLVSS